LLPPPLLLVGFIGAVSTHAAQSLYIYSL